MSGPIARVDPALAAALDRYDVPAASAGVADRIAAAAMTRGQGEGRAPEAKPRDRRGPWRRRAFVGGVAALLLGTAAAAAGLLERVGIHVPAAVALLSPPAAQPAPLAAMPPAERRVAVRALVRRAQARAALRRETVAAGGEMPPAPVPPERWLRERRARREALIDRPATMRANADARRFGDKPPPTMAPTAPAPAMSPDARTGPTSGSPRRDWAERFERRRALREMRVGRPGWHRFRRS